jgi:hypothetical protein
MDEQLRLYLAQRATLLTSDDAGLALLKRHDRSLLSSLANGGLAGPLGSREGANTALLEALDEDLHAATLVLEARARIWPGELGRVQSLLVGEPDKETAAWWLAAHYSALPFPESFPQAWSAQVLAAPALLRRESSERLPELWLDWARAIRGEQPVLPVIRALWQASQGLGWETWLAPLLAGADREGVVTTVNWLAGKADDETLVRMMGLSCHSHFLPWLASMRHDARLAKPALREILWLTGRQNQCLHDRQCWGEALSPGLWPVLFRQLPLGFRSRLWPLCGFSIQGATASLQGGQWCAGN